jgi:hypothetical protein
MQFQPGRNTGDLYRPPDFNKMDIQRVLELYVVDNLLYFQIADPCDCMFTSCRCQNRNPKLSWNQAYEILPTGFMCEGKKLHAFLNNLFVEQCVLQCTKHVHAFFESSNYDYSFAYSTIVEYCIGIKITVEDNESNLIIIPEKSKLRRLINAFMDNYIHLFKGRMNRQNFLEKKPYIQTKFETLIREYQKKIDMYDKINMVEMQKKIEDILNEVGEYNQKYEQVETELECSKNAYELIIQIIKEMERIITKVEESVTSPFIVRFCAGMDLRVPSEEDPEEDY